MVVILDLEVSSCSNCEDLSIAPDELAVQIGNRREYISAHPPTAAARRWRDCLWRLIETHQQADGSREHSRAIAAVFEDGQDSA
ncbi:MAG: hypothetical protein WDM76_09615 [Limisphaerales bacterium]